jgi:hypothetical protein
MEPYKKIQNIRREVEYGLYRDLPLVDLEGKDNKTGTKAIGNAIRQCLSKVDIFTKIEMGEDNTPNGQHFYTTFKDGDRVYTVIITFNRLRWWVESRLIYREVPSDKMGDICKLTNMFNESIELGTVHVHINTNTIVIESGMHVTRYFNSQQLFIQLRQMLARASMHFPYIDELIDTDQDACSIIKRVFEDRQGLIKESQKMME